jgi:hypothetical protein
MRIGLPAALFGGPGALLGLPGIRTASFLASTFIRGLRHDHRHPIPKARVSAPLAAKVIVDETIRGLMVAMARYPVSRSHRERIRSELETALELYEAEGWLDDPRSFHQDPPALHRPRITRRRATGVDFEHLEFKSGYAPRAGEPARRRWLSYAANRDAHAWVLRHRDEDRPWLVCIPGFRMGTPAVDIGGLRAAYHHFDLGLNVLIPVLPLHGPRMIGSRSGDGYISADLLNSIHAEAQAMWDLRRLLGWVRKTTSEPVGVYGVSLGGYNTALLAGLDDALACAIAGIPATCFPTLLRLHTPGPLLWLAEKLGVEWDKAYRIMRVVSPLAIEPLVPRERRYVFAGLADRLVPPEHVHALWEHWERPRMVWYPGSHLSFHWERPVRQLMHDALIESGLLGGERDAGSTRRRRTKTKVSRKTATSRSRSAAA